MRIQSPIVEADQRLGLPQFPSLLTAEAYAPTAEADVDPSFGDAPATANAVASARHAPTPNVAAIDTNRVEQRAPNVAPESAQTPAAQAHSFAPQADSSQASSSVNPAPRAAIASPQAPFASDTGRARVLASSPRIESVPSAGDDGVETARDESSIALAPRSELGRAEQPARALPANLDAAMRELNAWLGAPKNAPTAADARAAEPRTQSAAAPAAGSVREAVPTQVSQRPEPRQAPTLLVAAPSAPQANVGVAPAPVIHIGRIEVEVVPPAAATATRNISAAPQRSARAARPSASPATRRPFGWRQE